MLSLCVSYYINSLDFFLAAKQEMHRLWCYLPAYQSRTVDEGGGNRYHELVCGIGGKEKKKKEGRK